MSETTNWTGSASGARTGSMTVEITRDGTHMTGILRLLEPGVGELHAKFVGQWTTDNKLSAHTLEHFSSNSGGAVTLPQIGKMKGTFDVKENVITGHWRTEVDALGEFRWFHALSTHPKPLGALVVVPMQVVRCWERFATNTKMLFGKSRITWDKRYTKWLMVALQLALAGFIGFLVFAFVADFLAGN
jgi:hypothetical protein